MVSTYRLHPLLLCLVPSNTADASYFDNGRTVSEMEISRGLLGLIDGLQYLHTVQRKLHLNIAPEAIVITAEGNWKFCSFGLSLAFQSGEGIARIPSPYFMRSDPNAHVIRLEPDLRYSGVELTTGGFNPVGIRYLTPACDVFSLGVLSYEVYRFNIQAAPHSSIIGVVNNNVVFHHPALQALEVLDFTFLPQQGSGSGGGLKEILRGMLQNAAESRLKTHEISNHSYFVSGALMCLRNVDTLASRDIGMQSAQLISLPQHMGTFPPRVLQRIVLPTICKICQSNPSLWVHAISIHIYLSDRMAGQKYKGIYDAFVNLDCLLILFGHCRLLRY